MSDMENNNVAIFAYSFENEFNIKALNSDELSFSINNSSMSIANFDGNNPDSKLWLESNAKFLEKSTIKSLFQDNSLAKIKQQNHSIFVNLKNIDNNYKISEINLWLDQYGIISVQKNFFEPALILMNSIESGKTFNNTSEILTFYLDKIIKSADRNLSLIKEKLEIINNSLSNNSSHKIFSKILDLKKDINSYQKFISSQKRIINDLNLVNFHWIPEDSLEDFREISDQFKYFENEIKFCSKELKTLKAEIKNKINLRNNKILNKIFIVNAVFLPLIFFSNLFGMNLSNIPLANEESAFYIIFYFMIVIFGALYLILREKNED